MLVPCLSLCKDEKWLAMNANRYGFSVDSDSITFTPAAITAEETA
jgi:LAS superfamily LD-carboxypeptidase LdcB